MATRSNLAYWTGESGDPAEARSLYRDLLPEVEQVLGPRHPHTLATCSNVAFWIGRCGDKR